nr:hypothetical protein Iba_chr15cCG4690 [Ipomoea batatas]
MVISSPLLEHIHINEDEINLARMIEEECMEPRPAPMKLAHMLWVSLRPSARFATTRFGPMLSLVKSLPHLVMSF